MGFGEQEVKESEFYRKRVLAHLKRRGFTVYRIETGATVEGVPDVYCMQRGSILWVEMKSVAREVKKVVSPSWQSGQITFGNKCRSFGIPWELHIFVNGIHYFTDIAKEKYDIDELNTHSREE
jgi:hypothetical protein